MTPIPEAGSVEVARDPEARQLRTRFRQAEQELCPAGAAVRRRLPTRLPAVQAGRGSLTYDVGTASRPGHQGL